jgi:ABC-type antimicrobial peptide transport system permease subunit
MDFVRKRFIDNGIDFDAWNFWSSSTYVKTAEGVTVPQLSETIAHSVDQFFEEEEETTLYALNISDVYMEFTEAKRDIRIFFSIALAILVMACINFVNLSTARFKARIGEVGIRKIVGASRVRLVFQFLGESLFLILAGFLLGLVLTEATLPFFNSLFNLQLSLQLLASAHAVVIGGGIILFTGLASAIYPAIVLSGYQPVQIVRDQLGGTAGWFSLRRALVVCQFALAAIIIIGSAVVLDQINFIKSKDVGYNKDQVVNIELTAGSHTQYVTLRDQLRQLPQVSSVTGAAGVLPYWDLQTSATWPGLDTETEESVYFNFVDIDFLKTFGIDLIEGRGFDQAFAGEDQTGCIVNKTLARMMNQPEVLGSQIDVWDRKRTVIGLAEDFNFRPFDQAIGPLAIIKIEQDDPIFVGVSYLSIRVERGDIAATLSDIENVWSSVLPDVPFVYSFLDEEFNREYASLERLSTLAFCFCGLAVLIAGLGLFGLASFSAEQRVKELAIRKVLGASQSAVVYLILGEYLALIGLANLVAWPMAGYIMSEWLANFVYRVNVRIDTMVAVGIVTLIIALLSAGYKAMRAATANPIDSLKYE